MVLCRYYSSDHRWVPPHSQGGGLQQSDAMLHGKKVKRRTAAATDSGSDRIAGNRRSEDPGGCCGACAGGQFYNFTNQTYRFVCSSLAPFLQICANLDSAIVSTKNYEPELKKKVPRPVKTFDIVEKRHAVSLFFQLLKAVIESNLHSYAGFLSGSTWRLSKVDDAADPRLHEPSSWRQAQTVWNTGVWSRCGDFGAAR